MDSIVIHDLRLKLRIGAEELERSAPQEVALDLEMFFDLEPAGRTADISRTVSYADAVELVTATLERKAWVLLEELAEETAAELLRAYSRISAAKVEARKFVLPQAAWCAIRIERRRAQD